MDGRTFKDVVSNTIPQRKMVIQTQHERFSEDDKIKWRIAKQKIRVVEGEVSEENMEWLRRMLLVRP